MSNQLHVVLYEPEIPPNTGNIIRLCANSGAQLHLIHPLGFKLDEKKLRRAGLDYAEFVNLVEYENYQDFLERAQPKRLFACTTKGSSNYAHAEYQAGDMLLFGPETRGLPDEVLATFDPEYKIRIPMQKTSRSINLCNAVSIILFEAWRQLGFE